MQTFPYSVIDEHGEVIASGTTNDIELVPGTVIPQRAQVGDWWNGERFIARPAQPSMFHGWDKASHEWVDTRDVAQWRLLKWHEVKAEREKRVAAGVEVAGLGTFDADAAARSAVTAHWVLAAAAPEGWTVEWTRKDNTTVVLDLADFDRVAHAILGHEPAMHAISQALRKRIDAPEASIGELTAIRWPDG